MPDDGFLGLAIAVVADVLLGKRAQRHRWVRIINALGALLVLALIVGLIYATVKYS
jgi:hypothetical protein